jgi:hypothetical protein
VPAHAARKIVSYGRHVWNGFIPEVASRVMGSPMWDQ